jgi:hypothetical protein
MSADIIRLLPDQERSLIECYVRRARPPASFDALYDELQVPTDAEPSRLQIAVAQILLHDIQARLPQWITLNGDKVLTNRSSHVRHKHGRLRFNPQLMFGINWASTAPGLDWPEDYYVTYVPGFEKMIFTASRDGPDAWGCEDHAIGLSDVKRPLHSARKVVTDYWRDQAERGLECWESCIKEGLVNDRVASAWADCVWPRTDRRRERANGSARP